MQQNCDENPVAHVQWVKRDTLHANDYNPNVVARTERALLKLSIMEDGWTQPIVARTDGEIVDGFHRWSISADPDEVRRAPKILRQYAVVAQRF